MAAHLHIGMGGSSDLSRCPSWRHIGRKRAVALHGDDESGLDRFDVLSRLRHLRFRLLSLIGRYVGPLEKAFERLESTLTLSKIVKVLLRRRIVGDRVLYLLRTGRAGLRDLRGLSHGGELLRSRRRRSCLSCLRARGLNRGCTQFSHPSFAKEERRRTSLSLLLLSTGRGEELLESVKLGLRELTVVVGLVEALEESRIAHELLLEKLRASVRHQAH